MAYTVEQIKVKVGTDSKWAERAVVALWHRQTAHEQGMQATIEHNGVGFNGVDAGILSSFAEQVRRGRTLSERQLRIAYKKLPKYARQLHSIAYGN